MPTPEDYVRWVHENTRNWGTWQPYETMDLGDIGYFTKAKIFETTDFNAEGLLGKRPRPGAKHEITDCIIGKHRKFDISGYGQGGIASVGSSLTVSIGKEKGCLLYIAHGYTQKLRKVEALLSRMRDAVLAKDWRLDYVLVGKRLVVRDGFAVLFNKGDASLSFTAKAPLAVNQSVEAALKAGVGFQGSSGEVDFYTLSGESTPTFGCAWRVRRDLRDALFGGKASRADVHDLVFGAGGSPSINKEEILSHAPDWLFEKHYMFDALP
ncbi:hypothetical protein FBY35_7181 [Streptomyces sp. SLBN-118]|uniref:hypothetical protein n=1 Tax=Streptomyces sp. SLBN-118 TaxID=2768454 RepID=UPI00114DCC51|nr:hypothetical protein [Streptomyces sp. SLBN-118]TQK45597.1 hypothetical protein FBY35_7181 [Streptomyces sp. SLBN-118]